jgi:putative transposase
MQRKVLFSIGEYYHIYNRGNDKRKIFLDHKDYLRFLFLLYICNSNRAVNIRSQFPKGVAFAELLNFDRGETLVDIGTYCLMPNHFHLLIRERTQDGITKFLGKLLTSYSMYFNRKYKRTGKLFEGAFKAIHADTDEYLNYLFSYIHLNPIKIIDSQWKNRNIKDKEKAEQFLKKYEYSSYLDYTNVERQEWIILNKDAFPKYFSNFKHFENFVKEWLNYQQ